MLSKQIKVHLKFCQVKIHVQATCESQDLNMDFLSFDKAWLLTDMLIGIYARTVVYTLINIIL